MKKSTFKKLNLLVVVCLVLLASIVCTTVLCSCKDNPNEGDITKKDYTLTFVTNGGNEIAPITAPFGASIPSVKNPTKDGYVFVGWFVNADFSGESVTIPERMPKEDITYYALFELDNKGDENLVTIEYNVNLDGVKYESIPSVKTDSILNYKTADGNLFAVEGYMFLCWTTTPNGAFSLSGTKENGQFYAGETLNLSNENVTLYARWAKEYKNANEGDEKLFVCEDLVGKGLGASILVREGKENKLGFVESEESVGKGYAEFTFYFEESEGGIVTGRLYTKEGSFAFPDGVKGEYLKYDYQTGAYDVYILALDGFGSSVLMELVGSQTSVYCYGSYEYMKDYGDYCFTILDPETQKPVLDENNEPNLFYFTLSNKEVENTEFDGEFSIQGLESGSYLLYDNGEIFDYRLDLNGYGVAKLYFYDQTSEESELIAEGTYKATENYESFYGEWEFLSENPEVNEMKFVLSYISSEDNNITIYIEYNADFNNTFADESGNGDTLYLDGYGGALYSTGTLSVEGNCTVGENLVTFVPYYEDEDGNVTVGKKLYFNLNFETLTFNVNSDGFILDGTKLVKYEGESDIVVIPNGVTEISDNAFNYTYTDVSLISVTIPDSVTVIGKHAFQNGYTLQRVVFLASAPIEIDWSSDYDPFRWGAGNFVIIVPEGTQDAYKTAWSECKYEIKGSVEVTILPEFEVVDGVLVSYNKQPDSGDDLAITIPDEVSEIAQNVFRGLTYIKSVDFNKVVKIGKDAFYGNTGLTSANFSSVQIIEEGAFMGCYNLGGDDNGKVELLSVTSLGANAFSACESLKLVRLGENLYEIGDQAFSECQIYANENPLFVELLGSEPPEMGGKISIGNIAFKLKIQNIDVAIKCFLAPTWNSYIKHLYIESGSEKGLYLCGTDKLLLDGRAELMDSEIMMYAIDEEYIKFYWYDAETATYSIIDGEIKGGKITLNLGENKYVFTKASGMQTYVSDDGKYTLECNPIDLLPDSYADTNYSGVADGVLNGKAVKITVNGYNTKVIKNYSENGKTYNFSFTLEGDKLVYEMKLADGYVRNIKAEDGSEINLHYSGSLIYVFGTLNIAVGDNQTMPSWGDYGTLATQVEENVFTFTRNYRGTIYKITVRLSQDHTSFSYEYEIA